MEIICWLTRATCRQIHSRGTPRRSPTRHFYTAIGSFSFLFLAELTYRVCSAPRKSNIFFTSTLRHAWDRTVPVIPFQRISLYFWLYSNIDYNRFESHYPLSLFRRLGESEKENPLTTSSRAFCGDELAYFEDSPWKRDIFHRSRNHGTKSTRLARCRGSLTCFMCRRTLNFWLNGSINAGGM